MEPKKVQHLEGATRLLVPAGVEHIRSWFIVERSRYRGRLNPACHHPDFNIT